MVRPRRVTARPSSPPSRDNPGRSCSGPGRPGPAFVAATSAVAAHPGPEPPGARLVRPGLCLQRRRRRRGALRAGAARGPAGPAFDVAIVSAPAFVLTAPPSRRNSGRSRPGPGSFDALARPDRPGLRRRNLRHRGVSRAGAVRGRTGPAGAPSRRNSGRSRPGPVWSGPAFGVRFPPKVRSRGTCRPARGGPARGGTCRPARGGSVGSVGRGAGGRVGVFQGRTYSFGSDASLARQHALRRSAPKRITRSDTVSRLMMESLRSDWPGEVPSSGIYTAGATRGEAKKIPALRPTDVYWPWPLKRADLALPVWKQQRLFRLNREYWTDWTGRFISLSFGYLMYEYSCLLGSDVT